jgi:hypothetical protein
MRLPGRKSEAQRLLGTITDSLSAVRDASDRRTVLKGAAVAAGAAALTAGSAAVSSLRRRAESKS